MDRFEPHPDDPAERQKLEEERDLAWGKAEQERELEDHKPTFHPLSDDELAQRRLRRSVRPAKPKDEGGEAA